MEEIPLVAGWQRATHHLLAALDEELEELAVTPGEVNCLACFGGEKTMKVRELILLTGQKPSTFTGVLDRLERRGLIERRPDPGDRRAIVAALTREGIRASKSVARVFAEMERRLPDDLREAVRALGTLEADLLKRR